MKLDTKTIANRLVDAIWPPRCPSCFGLVAKNNTLCPDCWFCLHPPSGACCQLCAAPIRGTIEPICDICEAEGRPWERGFAGFRYEGLAREMILALKHGGREDYAPIMARMMVERFGNELRALDVILPMPIHWTRALKRHSNQTELMAAEIARLCGIVHFPNAARRIRATRPQGSSDIAREDNVRGVFELGRRAENLKGLRVGLFDDVMTSGSSLSELTICIQRAEPKAVHVFVFARASKLD